MVESGASRRVLVLGGSGALGGAVCRLVAGRGARVAFTFHRGEARAEALARELPGTLALRLDLASAAECEGAIGVAHAALGGLDALVQCAGVAVTRQDENGSAARQQVEDIDEAAWDAM